MSMRQQRQAGYLIARIHQVSGRIFNRLLKEQGITDINGAQGRILFVLWRKDRRPINEIARETSLGKSTLTSMLDRLEKAGHVRRVPSLEDRRTILVERTQKDRDLESRYVDVSSRMNRLFYGGLDESDIDVFEGRLREILANLTAVEGETG